MNIGPSLARRFVVAAILTCPLVLMLVPRASAEAKLVRIPTITPGA
jgi:hypothetical protein